MIKKLLIIFLLLTSTCYAADYSKIHEHPRIYRLSTDTWTGLNATIQSNVTEASRWSSFIGGDANYNYTTTSNGENYFMSVLGLMLVGKVQNNSLWYTTEVIPAVTRRAAITAITKSNPVNITATNHGFVPWSYVKITDVGGMTELNGNYYTVSIVGNVTTNTFELDVDSRTFGTYTGGGNCSVAIPRSGGTESSEQPSYFFKAAALIYDWLYDELNTTQKSTLRESIEDACEWAINNNDAEAKNEDYHNYYTGWLDAIVTSGIALYGDSANATKYLDYGLSRLVGQKNVTDADGQDTVDPSIYYNYQKSMNATGGACLFEGPGYYKNSIPKTAWAVEAWDTATDRYYNMWGDYKYFKNMENTGYAMIYMRSPYGYKFKDEDSTYGTYTYFPGLEAATLPLIAARFQNGYMKQFEDDKYSTVGDWGSYSGGQWGRRAHYFLFTDPTVAGNATSNLPLDMRLGEYTTMQNNWSTSGTYVTFKTGYHWKSHQHEDHGGFQIMRGANLLTGHSGWYDNSSWIPPDHRVAWFHQAIASNCIIIYNATEVQNSGSIWGGNIPNAGGQRIMNYMRVPPFDVSQINGTVRLGGGAMIANGGHDVADTGYGVTNRYEELARYGAITAQILNNASYAYTKANLTKAYTNAYSGTGGYNVNKKANLVERSIVYWRPDKVIVYDRVNTTNTQDQVTFVTHQPYPVSVNNGTWLNNATDGITNYTTGDKARWDYGADRVFQKTLLPATNFKYKVVGGNGYSCFIESTGYNYKPDLGNIGLTETDPKLLPWRIEVNANNGTTAYKFLNLFDISNTSNINETNSTLVQGTQTDGVYMPDTRELIMFADSNQGLNQTVFSVNGTGAAKFLLCGMNPSTTFNVTQNNGTTTTANSSDQGVLWLTPTLTGTDYFSIVYGTAVPVAPSAPAITSATPGDKFVMVNWTASTGATKYYLNRGVASLTYNNFTDVGNVTGYNVTDLTNGTTYYFAVNAYNTSGNSTPSNEKSAIPNSNAVPSAPTLNAAIGGAQNVSLSWSISPTPSGFYVDRGVSPGVYNNHTLLGPVTSTVATGLENGTTYYFSVKAFNANGNSTQSNELPATTINGTTPVVPSDVIFSIEGA